MKKDIEIIFPDGDIAEAIGGFREYIEIENQYKRESILFVVSVILLVVFGLIMLISGVQ